MAIAKMKCPECGVDLNHHADKLTYPTCPADAAKVDPRLGGVVAEIHTCPECGLTTTRGVTGLRG
jgi:endogenous inhibitor of DNA gyrase (YacG/DUF329 family)